jgi:hypothetical protein
VSLLEVKEGGWSFRFKDYAFTDDPLEFKTSVMTGQAWPLASIILGVLFYLLFQL